MARLTRWFSIGLLLVVLVVLTGVVAAHLTDVSPVVSTVPVGSTPVSLAVDARTGRAFVVNNGDNSVSVIDSDRGRLLRTIGVGPGPTAVVVDEPGRRVLVTNADTRVSQQTAQIGILYFMGGSRYSGGYMGTDTRRLSVLEAMSGHLVQEIPAHVSPLGAVVARHSGHLFVTTAQVGLFSSGTGGVLKVVRGQVAPLAMAPGMPLAVAVDERANRVIVVGDADGGTVSVLDATSGRLVHRGVIGMVLIGHSLAVDEATGRAFVSTANLAADKGSVYVFDSHSGRPLHTIVLPTMPVGMTVDERTGHVFVSTMGPAALIPSGPGFGRQAIPVSTGHGSVVMLDARRGSVIRSVPVGIGPGAMAVDARRHHLLVTNVGAMDSAGNPLGPGRVSVLDTRSGAVLRTVPVGLAPGDVAVDERAGRAFVLNLGGTVHVTDAWAWLPSWLRRRLPFVPRQAPGARTVGGSVTVLDTTRL
jgi:YVTN family beta-propeller protein